MIVFLQGTLNETKVHQILDNQYIQIYLKSLKVSLVLKDMWSKSIIKQ